MTPYSVNHNYANGLSTPHAGLPNAFVAPLYNPSNRPVLNVPVLMWDPAYLTNRVKWYELLRRISDFMLLNGQGIYADNPNQPYLYDVADGKLRREDYDPLMKLFGREGAVPLKENNFFHGAEQALLGQILNQPFAFASHNTNKSFAQQMIVEDSKKGAKLATEAWLRQMMAGGDGSVAPASDPSLDLPKIPEDWLDHATGVEQVEGVMYKLLHHIGNTHNWKELERESIFHKMRVNAEFAHIRVENGEVVPEIIHPHMVRIMASKPVKTLEDPAVLGCQVNRYMTPTELVNRFGLGRLGTGTGTKGVKAYFDEIVKRDRQSIGYDPFATYLTEQTYSNQWGPPNTYTSQQINWMNTFYPISGNGTTLMMQLLVQDNYFVMQREKRFLVEKIERGQRSTATSRELEHWQKQRADVSYDIDFTPLPQQEKANGRTVKNYVRPQLFQFTRIGHSSFIEDGPYPFQPDFLDDNRERNRMSWPVVGQISRKKSMFKLGENDAAQANVLNQRASMMIASLGFEEVIIVDDIHGKDAVSYLYNAKQTGIIRINSTKYTPGQSAQLLHLKTLKIGNQTEQILTIFKLIYQLTQNFELRVGGSKDVQGGANPYQSAEAQRLNVAGQQLLNTEFNYEHSLFFNQVLQRCADIAKFHYAKDGEILRILSPGEVEVVKTTANMRLADFHVFLKSGAALAEKQKMLQQLVNLLLQSGGIDQAEALLAIPMSDNPAEGLAEYRRLKAEMDQKQQQMQGAAQQTAIQQSEAAAKLQADKQAHELVMKRMEAELQIYLKQMDKNTADAEPPADLVNQPPPAA